MAIFGVVLAMEIGFCKFVDVSFNDLKHICTSLNERDFNDKKLTKTILKEAFELHQEIIKYLDSPYKMSHQFKHSFFHSNSFLRIGKNLQTILAGSLFFQMLVCAVFLAFIWLSIDQNGQTITSDVVINIFCLLLELQLNFTSCSYAQSLTNRFSDVAEDFYDISWYRLPCNQQKLIAMTIHEAQQPFYLKGYKLFTCSMETLLAV